MSLSLQETFTVAQFFTTPTFQLCKPRWSQNLSGVKEEVLASRGEHWSGQGRWERAEEEMAVNWELRGTDQGKWKGARRRGREGTNLGALELMGLGCQAN